MERVALFAQRTLERVLPRGAPLARPTGIRWGLCSIVTPELHSLAVTSHTSQSTSSVVLRVGQPLPFMSWPGAVDGDRVDGAGSTPVRGSRRLHDRLGQRVALALDLPLLVGESFVPPHDVGRGDRRGSALRAPLAAHATKTGPTVSTVSERWHRACETAYLSIDLVPPRCRLTRRRQRALRISGLLRGPPSPFGTTLECTQTGDVLARQHPIGSVRNRREPSRRNTIASGDCRGHLVTRPRSKALSPSRVDDALIATSRCMLGADGLQGHA